MNKSGALSDLRVVFIVSLAAALLLAAGFGLAHWRQSALWQKSRDMFIQNLDQGQSGVSLFRLRSHPRKDHFTWSFMRVSGPDFPQGPIPGKNDYRVALLAGLVLDEPTRVDFMAASDDGLRLYLDGKLIVDTWGMHPRIEGRHDALLAAGAHVLELVYTQMYGGQSLTLAVKDGAGRPLLLKPVSTRMDTARWQGLKERRVLWGFWSKLMAALAIGFLLLPPAWWLLRRGPGLAGRVWLALSPAPVWRNLRDSSLGRWGLAREGLWFPAMAFLVFLAVVTAMLFIQTGRPLDYLMGASFDAHWYRDITVHGYTINRHDSGVMHHTGNYCWYPLLPILAKPFYSLGLSRHLSTMFTAWLAALGAFYLLYHQARRMYGAKAGRYSLVALAGWPASFYLLLGYPYGLGILFGLAYFMALDRSRYAWAGLWGLLLGLSYPTGVLYGVLLLFIMLPRIHQAEDPWPRVGGAAWAGMGLLLGFLAIFIHHWLVFDDFFLVTSSQVKWGTGLKPALAGYLGSVGQVGRPASGGFGLFVDKRPAAGPGAPPAGRALGRDIGFYPGARRLGQPLGQLPPVPHGLALVFDDGKLFPSSLAQAPPGRLRPVSHLADISAPLGGQ